MRTKTFASASIRLFTKLPKTEEARILGRQLLRSGTSIAAQTREAARARSNAEFGSKLGGAIQEAEESILWLELLREDCGADPQLALPFEKEASELIAIFVTMIRRTGENSSKLKAEG